MRPSTAESSAIARAPAPVAMRPACFRSPAFAPSVTQLRIIPVSVVTYPSCLSSPLSPTSAAARASHPPHACMVSQSSRRLHEHQSVAVSVTSISSSATSPPPSPSSSSTAPHYGATPAASSTAAAKPPIVPTPSTPPPPPPSSPDPRLIGAAAFLVFVIAAGGIAAATGLITPNSLLQLASWFETLGPNAVLLYAALYFVLELIAVPALPLTLGSGYLFGVVTGTIAVSISSTAAAAVAFVIARYGLRDAITNVATRYPRFRAMDRAIARQGFKFVFLLRLSPLLPFSISNYLYGLTSVDLFQYLVASWLGMLPGTIAYVSAGAAVSALADIGSTGKPHVSPVLLVIGLVSTVAALTTIGKMAAEAVNAVEDGELVSDEEGLTEGLDSSQT